MTNEKTTQSIIMSPGTNAIDDFTLRYVFYCEQVLKEIHRQQSQRKIMKDSTPIKIEDELSNCMMTILQRFGVVDVETPIQCGYICQLTNELQDHELVPLLIENRTGCNLSTGSMKHTVHTIKIPEYQIEELQELLRGPFHADIFDIPDIAGEHDIALFEQWVASEGKSFLDGVTDQLKWHPFKSKEEVDIDIITYRLTRTTSTVKEFNNMNITTAEIVKMMWADLLEEAVNMQLGVDKN